MITSAASASDLGPLQPDQVVALHYRVQAAGEQAHCGWVYRAMDQRTQQPVIIKCLPQPLTTEARAYFAQVQRCRSRVLLPILAIVEPADQLPMLIIEAATGRRLDQLLAEGARLQPAQAFKLGRDLALALAELQAAGPLPIPVELLAPAHIYVTVIDMGNSVLVRDVRLTAHHYHAPREVSEGVTRTDEPAAIAYPTPEQVQGQSTTAASLQFQLGSLLVQLARGEPPFLAPSLAQWLHNVARTDAPKLADSPPGTAQIVERLLQKQPEARFPDLGQAARAIDRALGRHSATLIGNVRGLASHPPSWLPLAISAAPAEPEVPLPGWIGVDAPRQLRQGTQALVRAIAIRDLLQRDLVAGALQQDNTLVVEAALRRSVRLELIAAEPDSLGVKPLTPLVQSLAKDELTVWEWLLSGFLPGEHSLFLTITNLLDEPGGRSDRALPSRRLTVQVAVTGEHARPIFNTAGLRKLMSLVLPQAADLDALCIDHFPEVYSRFGPSMDRLVKVNLLLSLAEGAKIYDALKESSPQELEQHAAACALSAAAKQIDAAPAPSSPAAFPHASFALRAPATARRQAAAQASRPALGRLTALAIALLALTLLALGLALR